MSFWKNHVDLFSSVLTKPVKQSMLSKHILELRLDTHPPFLEQKLTVRISSDFSQRNPLRILVAEDKMVNQKLTEWVLSKLGDKSEVVMNGQQALEAANQQLYDLPDDVQMPEMDGLEATRLIRKADWYPTRHHSQDGKAMRETTSANQSSWKF